MVTPDPSASLRSDQERRRAQDTWHTFACPVCGHRDRALDDANRSSVRCPHCETLLEIDASSPEAEQVSVRVMRKPPGPVSRH